MMDYLNEYGTGSLLMNEIQAFYDGMPSECIKRSAQ